MSSAVAKDRPSAAFAGQTLFDLLRHRGRVQTDDVAYVFLRDGERDEQTITYGELDRRGRAVAAELQRSGAVGKPVLIQLESSIDYLVAFFGSILAGAIAVPSYPHKSSRTLPRLKTIVADSESQTVLTSKPLFLEVQRRLAAVAGLDELNWKIVEAVDIAAADDWKAPEVDPQTPAFLQYTSGSTSNPKGVVVTHGNIIANVRMLEMALQHSPNSRFVSWLPPFHDMGLIGNILLPLYLGSGCVLMTPNHFLQKPFRWLDAVSRYEARITGGPNFAFDLCVDKIDDDQVAKLDLSSLKACFNGAEPVRHATLERFTNKFKACGFRYGMFYPCYGMAETTLVATIGELGNPATVLPVDSAALAAGKAVPADPSSSSAQILVGNGQPWMGGQIRIVNPESRVEEPPGQVGEIWVAGPHVCPGYWNKPEINVQTFQATLSGGDDQQFVRTGDLGFVLDNELYVTGRAKDLIIIRGKNFYPHDIELTVESAHPVLQKHGSAAFSVEVNGAEALVVVQEVQREQRRNLPVEEVVQAIRAAVALEFGVQAYGIVLCNVGTVPKTSSGKVQRRACREAFLNGTLASLAQDILTLEPGVVPRWNLSKKSLYGVEPSRRQMLLDALLCVEISRLLRVSTHGLTLDQPISSFGLDEVSTAELIQKLRDELDLEITEKVLFSGITLTDLAQLISNEWAVPLPVEAIPDELIRSTEAAVRGWWDTEHPGAAPAYGRDTEFATLGMDSLAAASVAATLEAATGLTVTPGIIYEHQTIHSLAGYLARYGVSAPSVSSTATSSPSTDSQSESSAETGVAPIAIDHLAYFRDANVRLTKLKEAGAYFYGTEIDSCDGPWVTCGGKRMLMLASYSYLGLLGHPEVNEAAKASIDAFGSGTHGVRLLAGTFSEHRSLERELAAFMRADDAIVISSGFMTNVAVVSTLVGKGDVVIGDEWNHASLVDGCLFSGADFKMFPHNNVEALENLLKKAGRGRKLVIVDGVYSMDGDIAPLPQIIPLCRRYGAMLMVDEAHSLGVIGKTGRGVQEHFGLADNDIDIKMGTISKAIPSGGGFIAGNQDLIHFLRHHARGYIFSSSPTAPQLAAARKSFEILQREPERVAKLRHNGERFVAGLRKAGYRIPATESPIVPILFSDETRTLMITHRCREEGLFVVPVIYPAVPMNAPRIRALVMASHTDADVDFALDVFNRVGREVGVL